MYDRKWAQTLALKHIGASGYCNADDEIVLIEDATIEKPYGWVFFYSSKRWLETNDISYALAGNGPFLVERATGSIIEFCSAYPVEASLRGYARCAGNGSSFDPLRPDE